MSFRYRGTLPEHAQEDHKAHGAGGSVKPTRRGLLRAGGASIAGAAAVLTGFAGILSKSAEAAQRTASAGSLREEFATAAQRYGVPLDLLLAMGYVNTRLEMPAPTASNYRKGDPEGRGVYGIMALVRNPSSDTLGKAATLTGISPERMKTDRAANIMGGAALLAETQGERKPADPRHWLTVEHGGTEAQHMTPSGAGAADLYAGQVNDTLDSGFSLRLRSGERISLRGRKVR